MKNILFIIVLSSLPILTKAFPLENFQGYVVCDDCRSSSDYRNFIYKISPNKPVLGHLVYVVLNNEKKEIRQFRLYASGERLPDNTFLVRKEAVEESVDYTFNNDNIRTRIISSIENGYRYGFYKDTSDSRDSTFKLTAKARNQSIPPEVSGSAWDIVGSGYIENGISSYYFNSAASLDKIFAGMGSLMAAFMDVNLVTVKFNFADQSTATYYIQGVEEMGSFKMRFYQGVDIDGNYIINNPDNYQSGVFSFQKGGWKNFMKFVEAMRRLGIEVDTSDLTEDDLRKKPIVIIKMEGKNRVKLGSYTSGSSIPTDGVNISSEEYVDGQYIGAPGYGSEPIPPNGEVEVGPIQGSVVSEECQGPAVQWKKGCW